MGAVNQAFAISGVGDAGVARVMMFTGGSGAAGMMAHAPLIPLVGAGMVKMSGEGFVEYADGSLFQWGQDVGIDVVVSFARAFPHACRHVSVNVTQAPVGVLIVRQATEISQTSFKCAGGWLPLDGGAGGVAGDAFTWMAWGY